MGQPMYWYIGSGFWSGPYASYITNVTPGNLTPTLLDGKQIDSILFFQGMQLIFLEANSGIASVTIGEGSNTTNCILEQNMGSVDMYACEGISISPTYIVGTDRILNIDSAGAPPVLPSIPTWLTLTPVDSQVSLIWNSANNSDSYTLAWSENNSPIYTEITGITGTWYTHTSLTNGTYYCYKVRWVNTNGMSEYSSPSCTVPDTLPAVPTNLVASGVDTHTVVLNWDALPDGQGSFDIEYSTDGVNFMNVWDFSWGGGARSYQHGSLWTNATYSYRIRATKTYGVVSAWSDVVSATPEFHWLKVSSSRLSSCVIQMDHSVVCWWANDYGQTDVPIGLGQVKDISVGDYHVCAIRMDDLLQCWGYDYYWQSSIPDDIGTVKYVNATQWDTCAIRTNGSLRCWWYLWSNFSVAWDYTKVDGSGSRCALGATDNLWCWFGYSSSAIDFGMQWTQMCVIDTNHIITCWTNGYSQHYPNNWTSQPIGQTEVQSVSVGLYTSCAIKLDHTVVCWGTDNHMVPVEAVNIEEVTNGWYHVCWRDDQNRIYCSWTSTP